MKKPQKNIISVFRKNNSLLSPILNIPSSVFCHEHMLAYHWEKDAGGLSFKKGRIRMWSRLVQMECHSENSQTWTPPGLGNAQLAQSAWITLHNIFRRSWYFCQLSDKSLSLSHLISSWFLRFLISPSVDPQCVKLRHKYYPPLWVRGSIKYLKDIWNMCSNKGRCLMLLIDSLRAWELPPSSSDWCIQYIDHYLLSSKNSLRDSKALPTP